MSRWKKSNPVEAAIQRANVKRQDAEYASQSLTVRLMILEAEDGQDATELLARLSVVIGYPCQAAAQVYGEQMPAWAKQLHGALRTIQQLCLEGYRWQSKYALALDRAVELALQPHPDLTASAKAIGLIDSNWFADQIHRHEVTPQSVNDH
jgi:hypothetical protein